MFFLAQKDLFYIKKFFSHILKTSILFIQQMKQYRIYIIKLETLMYCEKGKHATYQEMKRQSNKNKEYYSSALSPLQTEFVQTKATTPSLKSLIRLVKYWKKTQLKVR